MTAIILDSNVLISAALFPQGVAARAYDFIVTGGFEVIVPEFALGEMTTVAKRKFPEKLAAVEAFIATMRTAVQIEPDTSEVTGDESQIRDRSDWPIWRAAKSSGADVLVTGDKDFLESKLTDPRIMAPATFLAVFAPQHHP